MAIYANDVLEPVIRIRLHRMDKMQMEKPRITGFIVERRIECVIVKATQVGEHGISNQGSKNESYHIEETNSNACLAYE